VVQQAAAALSQIDGWIADEERRDADRRQGEERRPPPPAWLIQYGLNVRTSMPSTPETAGLRPRAAGAARTRNSGGSTDGGPVPTGKT
jgi:hypothetical protein